MSSMSQTPVFTSATRSRGYRLATAAGVAAIVYGASALGGLMTTPSLPWYANLAKPGFTPPNWLFPVAWTFLFTAMGVAIWRVLQVNDEVPGRTTAIGLFAVQLFLNVGWSFGFFYRQNPALGLVIIAAFITAIAATIIAFRRVDRMSAWLLYPYLAWVAYATALNIAIWRMN